MDQRKAVSWNIKIPMLCIAIGVQLLLLSSPSYAQSSAPLTGTSKVDLRTDLTTDSATQPPASYTSISTVIVTILSTLTPPPPPTPPPSSNGTSSSTSTSTATSHQTVPINTKISTEEPITDLPTDQTINEFISTQGFHTELPTTGFIIDEVNTTTSIWTSSVDESSTLATSSSPSISNSSDGMETMEPTSLSTLDIMNNDTMSLTTVGDDLSTNELVTDYINPTFEDFTTAASDEGIFTESFLRLIIIAGATAGSCIILLIVVFIIVCCCHRRRQRKKNARYYEFKKKDFSSKYEKVEQRNSLARRDRADGSTPIGGGWVFNSSGYHGDYEDETTPNVALRSISPLAVATPLLKVQTIEDQNGVPDSGHGGSITADDSALGLSPSLEEDIEMELNPLYKALGTSIGTGSEVRDHSYIGGDSDTISEGNEPVDDAPIRNVLLNSFGANRGEEAVEL